MSRRPGPHARGTEPRRSTRPGRGFARRGRCRTFRWRMGTGPGMAVRPPRQPCRHHHHYDEFSCFCPHDLPRGQCSHQARPTNSGNRYLRRKLLVTPAHPVARSFSHRPRPLTGQPLAPFGNRLLCRVRDFRLAEQAGLRTPCGRSQRACRHLRRHRARESDDARNDPLGRTRRPVGRQRDPGQPASPRSRLHGCIRLRRHRCGAHGTQPSGRDRIGGTPVRCPIPRSFRARIRHAEDHS